MLIIENGSGHERANSFVTPEQAREYYDENWGFEHLGNQGDPLVPEEDLKRALKAAFKYMKAKIPWAGLPTYPDQAGCFPRKLYEDQYYYQHYGHGGHGYSSLSDYKGKPFDGSKQGRHGYGRGGYGRNGTHNYSYLKYEANCRNFVGPCDIPEHIAEAQIRLTRDIVDGLLDPTGRLKPVITTSVSSENGSLSFHRPQALNQSPSGFQARSRDPLYSIRDLISPWMRVRVQSVRMMRG